MMVRLTCFSPVETGRLTYGDYLSRTLIKRLAESLDTDEKIKQRVLERPEAFRRLAGLDEAAMDRLLDQLDRDRGK